MPRVGIFKIGPLRAELRVDDADTIFGDFRLRFGSDNLALKSRNGQRTHMELVEPSDASSKFHHDDAIAVVLLEWPSVALLACIFLM